jgi:peptide/nickel transport system permease protein
MERATTGSETGGGATPRPVRRSRISTRRGVRLLLASAGLGVVILAGMGSSIVIPYNPVAIRLEQRLLHPGSHLSNGQIAWLGTDQLGRDLWAQTVHGAQVSLLVAGSTVTIAGGIGIPLGLLAGYYGGAIESLIMRFADFQLAIPPFLLAILIAAVLGQSVFNVIAILSVIRWAAFARLAHGEALTLKGNDYVEAARALGASHVRVMRRHLFPNMLTPLIIVAALLVATQMLAEAALSFIGLGIPPTTPSLGVTISQGRNYLDSAWWISTMPGVFLTLIVMVVAWFGDALRDHLDPHTR